MHKEICILGRIIVLQIIFRKADFYSNIFLERGIRGANWFKMKRISILVANDEVEIAELIGIHKKNKDIML